MTLSLIREQFLDRTWSPADLDAVAEFWLSLYERAARSSSFSKTPDHCTEIQLRGFPRADAERLAALFAARAVGTEFAEPEISHPDPDTLSLSTGLLDGRDAPPPGLGLPVLAAEEFDGLVAEIRFTARDDRGKCLSTIVMAGEVCRESFILKAVWRVGAVKSDDDAFRHATWIEEAAFLAALAEFRSSGALPRRLANRLFPDRGDARLGRLIQWLIMVPFGKPRLKALLSRAGAHAGIIGSASALAYWVSNPNDSITWVIAALLPLVLSFLFWLFLLHEWKLWSFAYAFTRTLFQLIDEEGRRMAPLTPQESAAANSHVYIRKYTADLTAAGFTLLGEARLSPASVGEILFRVFAAPDRSTYTTIIFQTTSLLDPGKTIHCWPAQVSFMCHTFLSGGGHAVSMNWLRHGYRPKRTGSECLARVFPNETDPIAYTQLHAEAVAKFVAETGHPPLGHVRFEEFVRLYNWQAEEESRLSVDHPYTWADHLHFYLQIVRREYRG